MSIIRMSIEAGILIILLIIIRSIAITHMPKRTFVFIWSMILVRLLVPFSIPIDSILGRNKLGSILAEAEFGSLNNLIVSASGISNEPTSNAATMDHAIFSIIWIAGSMMLALLFFVLYLKSVRAMKEAIPLSSTHINKWFKDNSIETVNICKSDKIKSPLSVGFFNQKIVLPSDLCVNSSEELDYILLHEYTHLKRHDNILKILLLSAICFHWFNPLVWIMYVLCNRDIEISCDEKVILNYGVDTKYAYATTLLSLASCGTDLTIFITNFGKTSIEERIGVIMKTKEITFKTMALAVSAICLIAGIGFILSTSSIHASANSGNTEVLTEPDNTIDVINKRPSEVVDDTGIDEYYSYEEYAKYVEQVRAELSDNVGEVVTFSDNITREVTQEEVDSLIKEYEKTLEDIGNGLKEGKPIKNEYGDDYTVFSRDDRLCEIKTEK